MTANTTCDGGVSWSVRFPPYKRCNNDDFDRDDDEVDDNFDCDDDDNIYREYFSLLNTFVSVLNNHPSNLL